MDKKAKQLGMNPSTASGRLVKDLLFSFVKDRPCYRCGNPLTRDTFSIEHVVPWLDSDDPVKNYFDLANIDFSHSSCNYAEARRPHKKYESKEEKQTAANAQQREAWNRLTKEQQQERRRQKYLRFGK